MNGWMDTHSIPKLSIKSKYTINITVLLEQLQQVLLVFGQGGDPNSAWVFITLWITWQWK